MSKFQNHYNRGAFPRQYKKVDISKSLTVPDQGMTVSELAARHRQGLPLGGARVPQYHGEDIELPDLSRMDLADIQELRESVDADIKRLKLKRTVMEQEIIQNKKKAQEEARKASDKKTDEQSEEEKP